MIKHNAHTPAGISVRWTLVGLAVLFGIYFIVNHGEHIMSYLPLVFLLGCLSMHLFMHGGHGKHNEHREKTPD